MPNARSQIWPFPGGLRLPGHKEISTDRPTARLPVPKHLILPLQQHIGAPAEPCVTAGERVAKGQLIARARGYVSAALHAPTSGTVIEIGPHPVPHPSELPAPCIVIESDGEDQWYTSRSAPRDYRDLERSELRNLIRESGIVGLGGAAFPTAPKLTPGSGRPIDTLILNGAECEPYISCDQMLMRESPGEILLGMRILRACVGAKRTIIGLEDNAPEAYTALHAALDADPDEDVRIVQVPTLYPAGGEHQLIQSLTGEEVPSGGLPLELGIVCHNVGTAAAVARAVVYAEPLISRIVTVTGTGVAEPRNVEALIGTPIRDLIAFCGGYMKKPVELIMGGPMMGLGLQSDAIPVTKATNCILVQGSVNSLTPALESPCIRCGACAEVCPASLLPQQLYWYARSKDMDKIQDYHLFDCIECGCCAYVCPSHIPLVQYYRYAKSKIWAQERERRQADSARQRHKARETRLAREKAEREARMRKKKQMLAQRQGQETDPKKAAIEAAVRRVRAKRAARQKPDPGEHDAEFGG